MMSSSYDQLLKQVESLKVENSHLKRELEDNSSHLTTLENEAINMKDVLSHLHQSMDTDQDNYRFDSSEIIDNLDTLDQNSNSSNDENTTDQSWSHLQTNNPFRNSDSQLTSDLQLSADLTGRAEEARGEEREGSVGGSSASQAQKSGASSPEGRSTPNKKRALTKEFYSHFQELDQERNQIVQEIQNEDEHRKWYYEQMENIKRKIETFPVADQYNLQVDMTRRQLEFESQRLREMMQQNLGSSEQIAQRHEARLQRIRLIEAEMIQMQQQYRAKTELEKRDSGTCDHVEREEEDGVVVTDATTNTLVSGEEFGTRTAHEIEAAQSEHGIYVSGPNGSKLVTIATQTPEERLLAEQAQLDGSLRLANQNLASLYHGAWPLNQGNESEGSLSALANQETASVMSFNSSDVSSTPSQHQRTVHHQLGTKVEMVYSLLSMLGTHDKDDMSRTLLAMSSSQDSCIAMRQSGCLPLLIQLLHGSDKDSGLLGNTRGSKTARARAAAALHNIVHSHPDDKRGRREARVLRLLEQIRAHCDQLRGGNEEEEEENRSRTGSGSTDIDHHPGPAIAALMKLSFDEEHRHAICTLGGLQAIAELLQLDHDVNGNTDEQYNITMRRYACMALTNLTFGDGTNKALLCSMRTSMKALVAQLQSSNEDLRQVAASVLRNLSWRADLASKKTLREVGSVTGLMYAAMEVKKESTLKSILSALWNLSAHCSENKADICAVSGALAFLVSSLTFKSPSKTLAIIENGGGILRNISSHIAVKEDYRKLLRHHGCLQILLKHLRSPSLTIVSNACGTLWNLSARCPEDQKALWDMGAVNMLRNLVHSKHKMISMGSAAALKNLLSAKPTLNNLEDGHFSKSNMPGLHVRKAKALEAEIDQNLSETCDNLETESPHGSPTENRKQDPHSSNTRLQYMYSSDQGGVYHVANPEQQQQQQQQAQPQQQQHRRPLMRGQLLHRGNSGDRSPHEKVLSPVRSVSRSASQDSVGSTHSDISHDRSPRVPNVLLKSTKLLQDRQTMSYDRGRDSQRSGGDTSSERGRIGANSRIMKVMAEVVMHASMDDGHPPYYALQAASGSSDGSVPSTSSRYGGGNDSIQDYSKHSTNNESLNNSKSSGHNSDKSLNINLSGLSQRMENLQLNLPESDQDEPIDYSMKYHESHGGPGQQEEHSPSAQQQRPNNQVTPSETSAFVKPIPKVQNYVGGGSGSGSSSGGGGNGSMRYNNQSGQPTQSNSNPIKHRKNFESKKSNLNTSGQFSGYAETDIDQDQPTNFSIRYAEQEDNHEYHDDQPINYSKRYEEDEANDSEDELHQSVVEQHRSVIEQRQDDLNLSIHDDAMKTFCTEDTPFLSQATSLTDLSGMKKGAESGGEKSEGREEAGSDRQSVADSQGTGRNTGTTVVHRKQMENLQNNNISKSPPGGSDAGGAGHPSSSMYSYTDSTATSSPGEKPRQYCTEGTPSNLSRGSSLSSLHSSDAHDSGSGSRSSHAPSRQEMVLQSIDENDCLDISSNADVTLRNEMADASFTSANTTMSPAAHGAKSVTFDDNNQVQQTPLMFSRCSSLGSLSSFDAHSVHSSVVSEYSRRASEVVSPSDLPDSPGDTMPPSPSHRKSPVKFGPDLNKSGTRRPEETKDPKQKQGGAPGPSATAMMRAKVAHICAIEPPTEFSDQPLNYAMEDSPEKGGEHEHFSCGSSLSALTIDDEPIPPAPRFAESALLQENKDESSPDATRLSDSTKSPEQNITVVENTQVSRSLILDDGDSSVSEGEEDLLALCISSALPVSSKKKMKRSTSDSYLKKKSSSFIPRPGTGKSSSKSGGLMPHSPSLGSMMPKYSASQKPAAEDEMFGGYDSPKRFETEGTPLNFSRRGSNSDLSELNFDDPTSREREEAAHNKSRDDNKSDVSSIGSDDNEDLLSEAISAAMPTYSGKQNWKKPQPARQVIDRTAEGSESKEKFKYPAPNFQKKSAAASTSTVPNIRQVHPGSAMPHHSGGDVMKTYADEGTPINFSRRTSLSDITDLDSERSGPTHAPQRPHTTAAPQGSKPPPDGSSNPSSFIGSSSYSGGGSAMDSPHVFGVEGTPVSFSRNDSLSDLSCCDEDVELNMADLRGSPPKGMKSPGARSPKGAGGIPQRKPGIQSPAIARLKTPGKGHIPPPTNTSTPMGKQRSPPGANKDSPKTYAVEDTPYCMSRNSSLSSLNSDDHEGLANQSGGSASSDSANATAIAVHPKDEGKFKVEDTPLCFSDNSSLSSLSVESLSFEPSETENAMLEECINLAMPKNKKKVKTSKTLTKPESNLLRAGPSGTDANRRAPAASSSEETRVKTEAATETTQPKNLVGPQAERETERRATQDEVVSSAAATTAAAVEDTSFRPRKLSQEMDIRRKEEKDACNQEKLQAAAAAATCEETSTINDNKLAEELQEIEDKIAAFRLKGSETYDKDLCLEAVPIETSIEEEEVEKCDSHSEKRKRLTQMNSADSLDTPTEPNARSYDGDIMKESFPEMSSSIASTVMSDQSLSLSGSLSTFESNTVRIQKAIANSRAVAPSDDELDEPDDTTSDLQANGDADETLQDQEKEEKVKAHDMSAEDERALEENANIILSELSFTRELTDSALDEDIFIDNETISLVSNDCASDTASEASACLSVSSYTASEKGSEISCTTTLSQASEIAEAPKGPRIVKPGQAAAPEKPKEAVTGIRGRRRLLTAPRQISKSPAKPEANSPKGIKGGGGQKPKPITPNRITSLLKKTPTKTTPTKTIPGVRPGQKTSPAARTQSASPAGRGQTKVLPGRTASTPSPRGSNLTTTKTNSSSPKPTRTTKFGNSAKQITPPTKSGLPKSGIQKPGVKTTMSPKGADATKKTAKKASPKTEAAEVERPKPPIKQGTFTKDSPTQELIPIVSPGSEASPESPGTSKAEKTSPTGIPAVSGVRMREKRHSSASQRSRSSGESFSRKVLGDSSFDSDTSPRTPTKDSPTTPVGNKLRTSGSRTSIKSLPKAGSRTSLNKSPSGGSLHKTPSISSLNKGPKTPPRSSSLKQSDSASSLHKGAHSPRSTTPRSSIGGVKSNSPARGTTPTGRVAPNTRAVTPTAKTPTRAGSRSTTPTRPTSSRTSTTPTSTKSGLPNGKATTPPGQAPARKLSNTSTGSGTSTDVKGKKPKQAVSKIAGLWRKEPKKQPESAAKTNSAKTNGEVAKTELADNTNKKSFGIPTKSKKKTTTEPPVEAEAEAETGSGLKRSSTYDKLTPDTLAVANAARNDSEEDNVVIMVHPDTPEEPVKKIIPPAVPTRSNWRNTYTVPDGNFEVTDVTGAWATETAPNKADKQETPAKTTSSKKPSGISIWRKTEKKGKAAENGTGEPAPKKKGFSLWRKDVKKSKDAGPASSNEPSVRPVGVATVVSPIQSPTKPQASAIVQPYNYKPNHAQKSATLPANGSLASHAQKSATLPANGHLYNPGSAEAPQDAPSPTKHMTKTEMLMARRRRSYMTSLRSDESLTVSQESTSSDAQKASCLVTTV